VGGHLAPAPPEPEIPVLAAVRLDLEGEAPAVRVQPVFLAWPYGLYCRFRELHIPPPFREICHNVYHVFFKINGRGLTLGRGRGLTLGRPPRKKRIPR
jgi:hypothetical protein